MNCAVCGKKVDPAAEGALVGPKYAWCSGRHVTKWIKRQMREIYAADRGW